MDATPALIHSDFLLWIVFFFTLLLVAMLTYIYSNKNVELTFGLTGGLLGLILLFKAFLFVQHYVATVFLLGMESTGVTYRISRPNWWLFVDAWPLWILPAVVLIFAFSIVTYFTIRNFKLKLSKEIPEIIPNKKSSASSSLQMVTKQLEIDALKHALASADEKLAKAISEKDSQEIKNRDLQAKIKQYEKKSP